MRHANCCVTVNLPLRLAALLGKASAPQSSRTRGTEQTERYLGGRCSTHRLEWVTNLLQPECSIAVEQLWSDLQCLGGTDRVTGVYGHKHKHFSLLTVVEVCFDAIIYLLILIWNHQHSPPWLTLGVAYDLPTPYTAAGLEAGQLHLK